MHDTSLSAELENLSVLGEGLKFVRAQLAYAAAHRPSAIPGIFLRTVIKRLGYGAGRKHRYIPLPLKRRLSLNKRFWRAAG